MYKAIAAFIGINLHYAERIHKTLDHACRYPVLIVGKFLFDLIRNHRRLAARSLPITDFESIIAADATKVGILAAVQHR